MNKILYFASKYLKFKASDRGLSAIAVIAFLTIVISSAASVVILSAANGIHNNFLQKLMSKDYHAIFLGPGKGIPGYEKYLSQIKKIEGVEIAIPYFERQALLKGSLNVWGAMLMGIPPDTYKKDKDLKKQFGMQEGAFDLSEDKSIVLGYNLAMNLGVTVGSYVFVTIYSDEFFSIQYKFRVSGVFSAGHKDFDSSLAFISFKDAQEIFNSQGFAYGIAIKVKDPYQIEKYLEEIKKFCPYYPYSWKTLHRNDLAALNDEKMLIMIILSFFFIVVGFNILSTMIAMVLDKKEEIGILKAMGLKPSDTLKVFLFDGFFLGTSGSTVGILFGLFITVTLNDILKVIENCVNAVNISAFYLVKWIKPMPFPDKFQFFNSSVYYINEFPIRIEFNDILFIVILSVILGTIAVIIPALNAAKLRPVEVLRND